MQPKLGTAANADTNKPLHRLHPRLPRHPLLPLLPRRQQPRIQPARSTRTCRIMQRTCGHRTIHVTTTYWYDGVKWLALIPISMLRALLISAGWVIAHAISSLGPHRRKRKQQQASSPAASSPASPPAASSPPSAPAASDAACKQQNCVQSKSKRRRSPHNRWLVIVTATHWCDACTTALALGPLARR